MYGPGLRLPAGRTFGSPVRSSPTPGLPDKLPRNNVTQKDASHTPRVTCGHQVCPAHMLSNGGTREMFAPSAHVVISNYTSHWCSISLQARIYDGHPNAAVPRYLESAGRPL